MRGQQNHESSFGVAVNQFLKEHLQRKHATYRHIKAIHGDFFLLSVRSLYFFTYIYKFIECARCARFFFLSFFIFNCVWCEIYRMNKIEPIEIANTK